MKWTTAIRGLAITGLIGSLTLTGCGTAAKTSEKSTSSSSSTTSTSVAASKSASPKVAPRKAAKSVGPTPTIASYVQQNNIAESTVHRGDAGSPTIDLPIPDGWRSAGDDTPDWAYGAIVYTGPEAADYSPSIVLLVSKLTGNVDPKKIIDLAPGELNNLPYTNR